MFKSHRTEYVKLKKMKNKSWSGKVSLTSLQQWKLERYQFLDPYCTTRVPQDLGWVSICEDEFGEIQYSSPLLSSCFLSVIDHSISTNCFTCNLLWAI